MALTRTPEPAAGALNPRDSVAAYQSSILGGGRGSQPLPRTVMQTTTPKVPYPAKSGSGAMPTGEAGGIFNVVRPQSSASLTRSGSKTIRPKGGGLTVPSGGGYAGPGYSSGDRSGAYGLTGKAGSRLQALQSAYQKQFGQSLSVISGGRSYADQVKAWNAYKSGRGNLAARPGTSVHEQGNAVDFGGAAHGYSPQHTWLVNNAPNFGWTWAGKNFSQVEPWHFEYRGG